MHEIKYGVVMAGGKSTRFGREKCLLEINNRKLIDIAVGAVSQVLTCIVAISPNAPLTARYVMSKYRWMMTPGEGYVKDIEYIMKMLGEPFLTVVCDLPFLKKDHIIEILSSFKGKSVAGTHREKYVGINIVATEEEEIYEFDDPLLSININTPEDYEKVKTILMHKI